MSNKKKVVVISPAQRAWATRRRNAAMKVKTPSKGTLAALKAWETRRHNENA